MKFLNKKRIASAALAGALALSMAAPAFASNPSTTITGNFNEIRLSVTVPTTGKAIINPYGLPYTLGESTITGEQITTGAALTIQNKSAVGLKVGAKITTTATANVTLESSASNYDTETGKKLVVKFEAFPADNIAGDAAADTAALNAAFAALKSEDAVLTAVLSTGGVNAAKASGKSDLVLREANADGELQKGGAAFFRLSGQAAQGASWAKEDGFTSTIAFTFTPTAYTKPAGTLATTTKTLDSTASDGTEKTEVTLTLKLPDKVTAKKVEWVSSKTTLEVTDKSTGLGTASAVIKAEAKATGQIDSSSKAKVTVNITGSDGIIYTATTDADNSIEATA